MSISEGVSEIAVGDVNADGVGDYVDAPVITQFLRSHNPDIWCADTAIEVKSLVRKDFPLEYYGAHRPFHDEAKEILVHTCPEQFCNIWMVQIADNSNFIFQFPLEFGG